MSETQPTDPRSQSPPLGEPGAGTAPSSSSAAAGGQPSAPSAPPQPVDPTPASMMEAAAPPAVPSSVPSSTPSAASSSAPQEPPPASPAPIAQPTTAPVPPAAPQSQPPTAPQSQPPTAQQPQPPAAPQSQPPTAQPAPSYAQAHASSPPPAPAEPTLAAALSQNVRGVADQRRADGHYEPPPPPPTQGGAPVVAGVDYNFSPTHGNTLLHPRPIWVPFVPPPPAPDEIPTDRPFSPFLRWTCGTGTWGVAGRAALLLITAVGICALLASGRLDLGTATNEVDRGVASAIGGLIGMVLIILYAAIATALLNARPIGRGTVVVPLPLDDIVSVVTDYALENSFRKPSLSRDNWGNWNLQLEGQWGSGNPQVSLRLTPTYYGMEAFVVAMPGSSWLVTVHPQAAAVTRSILSQLQTSARLLFEMREKAAGREPPPAPVELGG